MSSKLTFLLVVSLLNLFSTRAVAHAAAAALPLSNRDWMARHHLVLENRTLLQMTLPATHDSGTFNLTRNFGPRLPDWVARLGFGCSDCAKHVSLTASCLTSSDWILHVAPSVDLYEIVDGWAKTQQLSIAAQLDYGVRYFDLRCVHDPLSDEFRIEHLLLAQQPLLDTLRDIATFMRSSSGRGEVVVLYISHLFGFTRVLHQRLLADLAAIFDSLLVPRSRALNSTTFGELVASDQRVLILYNDSVAVQDNKLVWPGWFDCLYFGFYLLILYVFTQKKKKKTLVEGNLIFEYPETDSVSEMVARDKRALLSSQGDGKALFYPQYILTESDTMVFEGVLDSNLVHTLRGLSRRVSSILEHLLASELLRRSEFVLFFDTLQEAGTVSFAKQRNVQNCWDRDPPHVCRKLCPLASAPPKPLPKQAKERCARSCDLCNRTGLLGSTCTSDADCQLRNCQANMCIDEVSLPIGASCGHNWQCKSTFCDTFNWKCLPKSLI